MKTVVLFGVGSPLAIDAQESCERSGVRIMAAIRNVAGPAFTSSEVPLVSLDHVTAAERAHAVIAPLFTPGHRKAALADAVSHGFSVAQVLVDVTSIVARSTRIGAGTYINAGCVIGGASVLGEAVLVNRSASIGHHVQIAELASIGPAAVLAGSARIGRGATIGAGAVVLPEITIGDNAVVGAGAVVTRSVPPHTIVVGNPARIVRSDIAGYNGMTV
jgi:sugar O-acyltransferase (sialic acid O-acetyltransferase NeuD family)